MFILSRLGIFEGDAPKLFENSAFPAGEESFNQFQRSWTNYTGELDNDINADALAALFEKVGDRILFTHSIGGTPFLFPEGEVPKIEKATFELLSASAQAVPLEDFMKLTKIPIVLYYGDFIQKSSELVGQDKWHTELEMAKKFVAAVNRHGGDATLVELPKVGFKGNTQNQCS